MAEASLASSTLAWSERGQRWKSLAVPFAFVCMMAVLVVPLPPALLDLMIAANISGAAVILLTVVYMERPLEFSVFPALLLGTTLYRLCLNIATTRLILSTEAATADEAAGAAGEVIRAFGQFVAGDSPIVGAVIFCILIIVQFVVITKGSTRISEVAARFTLDAMPGKQMAIDADLTAGLITESEARERREAIMREADFYGAMDGASKFVRGDAVAGIIITLINILGGFAIGAIMKGWTLRESLAVFTRLTIGDGLVSQIPAFVIAIAAGLIVARSGANQDLGTDLTNQLTSKPRALYITAGFLALMSFTGLPIVPMFACAAAIAGVGYVVSRGVQAVEAERAAASARSADSSRPATPAPDELLKIDHLELEVGYGLVKLVNESDGGTLLERIAMVRRQLAAELGLILPPVRIRDNSQLETTSYRIKIRGNQVAGGQTFPGSWLAMDSGLAQGPIDGTPTKEPAFGLDAWWIADHLRARAEAQGYTVVDATSVLITHFTETVKRHADELLTREEVNNLIANLKERAPKLTEEIIPDKVKPGELQKILQSLLRERVPVRDLETIVETMGEWVSHTRDADVLVEYVRNALRRTIAGQYATPDDEGRPRLYCITVDPRLEDLVASYVERSEVGTTITMPPSVSNRIIQSLDQSLKSLIHGGRPPVILTSPQIRGPLRRIIEPHLPQAAVLGFNEIPQGLEVESLALVQPPETRAATAA